MGTGLLMAEATPGGSRGSLQRLRLQTAPSAALARCSRQAPEDSWLVASFSESAQSQAGGPRGRRRSGERGAASKHGGPDSVCKKDRTPLLKWVTMGMFGMERLLFISAFPSGTSALSLAMQVGKHGATLMDRPFLPPPPVQLTPKQRAGQRRDLTPEDLNQGHLGAPAVVRSGPVREVFGRYSKQNLPVH